MTPRPPLKGPGPGRVHRLLVVVLRWLHRILDQISRGRIDSAVGVMVGVVWWLMSLLFFGSAAVDVVRGGPDWGILLLVAAVSATGGLLAARMSRFPQRLTVPKLFASVVWGTVAAVIAMMMAHLLTGTTTTLDSAFVESTATVTGTNASSLDPSMMSDGMLILRAAGQWAAGAALIVIVVRVLPHLGVGGLDADGGVATRSARRLSPRTGATMGRLLLLYSGLTALVCVGYLVAGMPAIDSGMHALTTISTGGFSSRSSSIGGYESGAIEWVAIFGMMAGGTSLPLMFLAARRKDPRRFARSLEF
ncbi:MAG: potassium transporter TrkG, partial [Actinomycetota bacterium]|nr:potassium transporter TrkG [Actinomycetota bacterium]